MGYDWRNDVLYAIHTTMITTQPKSIPIKCRRFIGILKKSSQSPMGHKTYWRAKINSRVYFAISAN